MTETLEYTGVAAYNGILTISNPTTGNHRTFKISTIKHGNLAGKRRASLLIGSDNTRDYQPFAIIGEGAYDQCVFVFKKLRGEDGKKSLFETYADMLSRPDHWRAKGFQYQLAAHCRRCNRLLTDKDSITLGWGPECRTKI